MLSDTDACVAKTLALCLKKKENCYWTDEWYKGRPNCTYEDQMDIKVD
jgi:hypothetical protein